jgi:hypothetical protein
MWIFMNDAMLSIVAHRNNKDCLLVRARCAGDIEKTFPDVKTYTDDCADYQHRANIPRVDVAYAISERLLDIDYDNFKNSIADDDHMRYVAYTEVWSAMFAFQASKHRNRITGKASRINILLL